VVLRQIKLLHADKERCIDFEMYDDVMFCWEQQMEVLDDTYPTYVHRYQTAGCDDPLDYTKLRHWKRFLREEWRAVYNLMIKTSVGRDSTAYTTASVKRHVSSDPYC
jgi:hypothetical protein